MLVVTPSSVPNDGSPTAGNAGVSVLPVPALKSVCRALSPSLGAVAGAAVGVEHVAGPRVGRDADLQAFAAFRTGDRRDDGRAVDPLADVGQQPRVDDPDLDRPAGAEGGGCAVRARALKPPVAQDEGSEEQPLALIA